MSAPAKKLRIEDIKNALEQEGIIESKIKAVLKRLKGFVPKGDIDAVAADDLFKELFPKEQKPAVLLRGARHRSDLTQQELAEKIGSNQAAIAAMESGKRPIGKNIAQRLSKVLGVDYRLFL